VQRPLTGGWDTVWKIEHGTTVTDRRLTAATVVYADAMADQTNTEEVAVDSLVVHPDNPRVGDIGAIISSIEHNGWYGTIVAQTSTRHVLAGNHRLMAAQALGLSTVPVYWVDVDDAKARRILLADNRATDRATYDDDRLLDLLTTVSEQDTLLGTGWDEDEVRNLVGLLDDDEVDDTPFDVLSPDTLETEYACPSCGYEWSGSPTPGKARHTSDDDDDTA
jgi:hypothetical protein